MVARRKNIRLAVLRHELGMTRAQFADAVLIAPATYDALECGRASPLGSFEYWRPACLRIANFHCLLPEDLWPNEAPVLKKMPQPWFCPGQESSPPDESVHREEMIGWIKRAVTGIPRRERVIFGRLLSARILGEEKGVAKKLSNEYEISTGRVYQIFNRAFERIKKWSKYPFTLEQWRIDICNETSASGEPPCTWFPYSRVRTFRPK